MAPTTEALTLTSTYRPKDELKEARIMPLTPEILSQWTRRIRRTFTPALNNPNFTLSMVLPPATLEELHAFFRDLHDTPFDVRLLRRTRVHRALLEMAEPGGGWPEGLASRADIMLDKLGPLVRAVETSGLWAAGGPMAGCHLVSGVESFSDLVCELNLHGNNADREWWAVEGPSNECTALQTGHVEFKVGWYVPSLLIRSPVSISVICL